MSIKLRIEPYCQECPNFKPKVVDDIVCSEGKITDKVKIIVCQDARICKQIERYLIKHITPEANVTEQKV